MGIITSWSQLIGEDTWSLAIQLVCVELFKGLIFLLFTLQDFQSVILETGLDVLKGRVFFLEI